MQTHHPNMLRLRERGRSSGSYDAGDRRPGRFATAARSIEGYARHSRKYSYGLVTIRKLLARCGA
jgi:hypothetical protein